MLARIDLPTVLRLNAISSGACGVLMAALAAPLGATLGVAPALLLWAGLALVPFAALVLFVARDPRPTWVKLVSAADFAWVAGSVALVALSPLTALGIAVVLGLAAVVDGFGTLQLLRLRRGAPILSAT